MNEQMSPTSSLHMELSGTKEINYMHSELPVASEAPSLYLGRDLSPIK